MEKINLKDINFHSDYIKFTKDPEVLFYIHEMELKNRKCIVNFLNKSFWYRWFHVREFELEMKNNLLKFESWYHKYKERKESKRIKNLTQDFKEAGELMSKINERKKIIA